jgi:5'-nucleotidase
MRRMLLTNDDGVDSPALVPFARTLAEIGEVTVVVPDRQRSWIGKALSRTGEVTLAATRRGDVPITTCNGYPADATQLGVHQVCDERPDVLVSGINLGLNHGAAFMLSSGTVGAAIEGWITGVPAIAFSTGVDGDGYRDWRRHITTAAAAATWARLAATCGEILRDVWDARLWDSADIVSVNLPFDATPDTPRRVTALAQIRYGGLFTSVSPNRYRFRLDGVVEPDTLAGTDVGAFRDGVVSVTPLRLPRAHDIPDDVRARIEQPPQPRRPSVS